MKGQLPHFLQSQRGIRPSTLRRLPRYWITRPQITSMALSPIICPTSIDLPVVLSTKPASENIAIFHFKIHGKCFRRTSEDVKTDQPQLPLFADTPSPLVLPTQTNSPYSHLYEILYPPPDDFASDSIARYKDLHSYQKEGVSFLVRSEHALLADDMGLGKTAQCSIAMAVLLKTERITRALVICPRSIVRQWRHEAKEWAGLNVTIVDGERRERVVIWEHRRGVLVTTPNIVLNDADLIAQHHFDLIVCDDISTLKNPQSKMANAIKKILRQRSWCLNGTPLENKPEDFMNTMQFVYPNLFSFAERSRVLTSKTIRERVKPYFLRRRKQDCLKDLPPKQMIGPLEIEMSDAQSHKYRAVEQQQWKEWQSSGTPRDKIHIFALITKLIQVCNFDPETKTSAKADEIKEQLEQILTEDQPETKAIIFSRYVESLHFLKKKYEKYHPILYYGEMSEKQREDAVSQFKMKGRLMLISTKAGARGLNLQMASYVFHFDRGWNPVDELQAEDRCWRMGQLNSVSVYRYLQIDTIEERIQQVLQKKRRMFDEYVDSMVEDTDELVKEKWSLEELISLLRPSTEQVSSNVEGD